MTCMFCAEQLAAGARICRHCGRPVLDGCARLLRLGEQGHIGELADGQIGLWPARGGDPVVLFPPAAQGGWPPAERLWIEEEQRPKLAAQRSHAGVIAAVVVTVIIVVLYIAYHAARYRTCYSSPGIFSWPSQCI